MTVVERHKSTCGLPDLIVQSDEDDWAVGFDGYSWHTHGDILHAWGYQGSPTEAIRQFVDDVLGSRRQIIVRRANGEITDLDVPVEREIDRTSEAKAIRQYSPGETAEIWYWNGQKFPIT